MTSIAAERVDTRPTAGTRSSLYLAWAIVVLLTVPEIILRAFLRVDTSWMLLARIGLLAGSFALTFAWPLIRPLRGMLVVFLVIYVVEAWLFLTAIPQSQIYRDVFGGDANLAFFGERLMRIGAVARDVCRSAAHGVRATRFVPGGRRPQSHGRADEAEDPRTGLSHGRRSGGTTRSSPSGCCCSS